MREETPARVLGPKMFCCLPLPRGRGLRRAHRQSVWDRCGRWLRAPRGGLWPFARRNRKVTREPQAGPGHLCHPTTRATLSPFPLNGDGGFSGCVCLKQAQMDVRSEACGPVPSPPQGRAGWAGWGESRQRWLPRLTLRPKRCLLPPGWLSERTHLSAGSRNSSGQKQQPYWPGPARKTPSTPG